MATEIKRFTISITPEMEADLDSLKQRLYYCDTRNTMIRDLIIRGLASLETEEAAKGKKRKARSGTST